MVLGITKRDNSYAQVKWAKDHNRFLTTNFLCNSILHYLQYLWQSVFEQASHVGVILLFSFYKNHSIDLFTRKFNVYTFELKVSNCSVFFVFIMHMNRNYWTKNLNQINRSTPVVFTYNCFSIHSLKTTTLCFIVSQIIVMFARDNQQDVDSFVFLPWTFKEAVCLARCFSFWDRHQQEAWISVSY